MTLGLRIILLLVTSKAAPRPEEDVASPTHAANPAPTLASSTAEGKLRCLAVTPPLAGLDVNEWLRSMSWPHAAKVAQNATPSLASGEQLATSVPCCGAMPTGVVIADQDTALGDRHQTPP